jgi:farnesyl-diphosphate farnesyltransferase
MSLQDILKGVSRSFYLSLRFLPARVRPAMSLAFLACKAADTITDTELLPSETRLAYLHEYRRLFPKENAEFFKNIARDLSVENVDPFEQNLLNALPQLFAELRQLSPFDLNLVRELVQELTQGMILDLTRFAPTSPEKITALVTESELDDYTYYVAGCVGRFWTRVLWQHFDFARRWDKAHMEQVGENFGKGLQLVNILRDLPQDLAQGRCYLPTESLQLHQLSPASLKQSKNLKNARPYLETVLASAREKLSDGQKYAASHPWYAWRLKWVVLLPMQLGFKTLDRLEQSPQWLDPGRVIKVSRRTVYRTMFECLCQSSVA